MGLRIVAITVSKGNDINNKKNSTRNNIRNNGSSNSELECAEQVSASK